MTNERVDIRDGKPYRVTVLPEVKPRKRRKPMMTKKAARAIAVGRALGAGPPTKLLGRRRKLKKRKRSK